MRSDGVVVVGAVGRRQRGRSGSIRPKAHGAESRFGQQGARARATHNRVDPRVVDAKARRAPRRGDAISGERGRKASQPTRQCLGGRRRTSRSIGYWSKSACRDPVEGKPKYDGCADVVLAARKLPLKECETKPALAVNVRRSPLALEVRYETVFFVEVSVSNRVLDCIGAARETPGHRRVRLGGGREEGREGYDCHAEERAGHGVPAHQPPCRTLAVRMRGLTSKRTCPTAQARVRGHPGAYRPT